MTLDQLIAKADQAYPGNHVNLKNPQTVIADYLHNDNANLGDTLALFVARELKDTFEPNLDEEGQRYEARQAIQRAADDLQAIANAL